MVTWVLTNGGDGEAGAGAAGAGGGGGEVVARTEK